MFDRRLVKCFDWGLLGLTVLLGTFGLITLYSAATAGKVTPQTTIYMKQLIWYAGGLVVMTVSFLFSYKLLERWAYPLFILCNSLLVWVLLFGRYIGGSRRWLVIGPLSIQPSELIKVAVILVLARYYARHVKTGGLNYRQLMMPVFLTAIPFALIVNQPDLGTAMMVALIAGTMTMFVKIEKRTLMTLVVTGAMIAPSGWFLLKDYQKRRILTLLDPASDPLGAGYHIIQSKIAIGSGQLTGKGYLMGTQNGLSFLPEQHTDFIFSVVAEEWGLMGAAVLLLTLFVFLLWGLNIAHCCRDPFGKVVAVGIVAMIFWQMFINIGMVMGLMPVVGMPLPFISYGGSSILTIMICVGILLNISMRRFMFE